jgi:hypothetical protein
VGEKEVACTNEGEKENACINEEEKGAACTNEREKMRPNQLVDWTKIFKNCDLQTRTEGVEIIIISFSADFIVISYYLNEFYSLHP